MLGGLVGRYGVDDDDTDYELAKPDEALTRYGTVQYSTSPSCRGAPALIGVSRI